MPREKVCRDCDRRYSEGVQNYDPPRCPECGSGNWEYADMRVREQDPTRVPVKGLKTEPRLPGSTEDYLGE